MKKLVLYPVNPKYTSLVRYRDTLQGYELSGAIVPKGRGLHGKDVSTIDGGSNLGFELSEDFYGHVDKCDTVLFLKGNDAMDNQNYIEKISYAKDKGKEVIITDELFSLINSIGCFVQYDRIIGDSELNLTAFLGDKFLKKIESPVIFVYGLGENCNKFDLQVSLRRNFLKKGYNVLQYGTKDISEMFGFEKIPSFIFSSEHSIQSRVIAFNNYIHKQENEVNPDVIIIGVPGGILPYNDCFYNQFSEVPYIISNALTPDIAILSVYLFPSINTEYLKKLATYAQYKYNSIINYFNISNSSYGINNDDDEPELFFLKNKTDTVCEIIKNNFENNDLNIDNVFSDSYNNFLDKICNELTENISVI